MMESKAVRPIWSGRIAGGEMATAANKYRRESKTRGCDKLEHRCHTSQMPPTGTGGDGRLLRSSDARSGNAKEAEYPVLVAAAREHAAVHEAIQVGNGFAHGQRKMKSFQIAAEQHGQ